MYSKISISPFENFSQSLEWDPKWNFNTDEKFLWTQGQGNKREQQTLYSGLQITCWVHSTNFIRYDSSLRCSSFTDFQRKSYREEVQAKSF